MVGIGTVPPAMDGIYNLPAFRAVAVTVVVVAATVDVVEKLLRLSCLRPLDHLLRLLVVVLGHDSCFHIRFVYAQNHFFFLLVLYQIRLHHSLIVCRLSTSYKASVNPSRILM